MLIYSANIHYWAQTLFLGLKTHCRTRPSLRLERLVGITQDLNVTLKSLDFI